MYLWNTDQLIKKLQNNSLSTLDLCFFGFAVPVLMLFNWFFFSTLLASHQLVSHLFSNFLETHDARLPLFNKIGLFVAFLTFAISICGIYLCYRTNKRGDGKRFFQRMITLSFPVMFNVTVYVLALFAFIGFLLYVFMHGRALLTEGHLSLKVSAQALGSVVKETFTAGTTATPVATKTRPLSRFIQWVFTGPTAITRLPSISAQLTEMAQTIRATLLFLYPFIAVLPPLISLGNCLIIRAMIKKVSRRRPSLVDETSKSC